MKETTKPIDDERLPDEAEQFTQVTTESVEVDFQGGSPNRVRLTVRWEQGIESNCEHGGHKRVDKHTKAIVEFRIDDSVATLTGFYPDTTKTGEMLYRETLRSLRVLPYAAEGVIDLVPDDVTVDPPYETIKQLFEDGRRPL